MTKKQSQSNYVGNILLERFNDCSQKGHVPIILHMYYSKVHSRWLLHQLHQAQYKMKLHHNRRLIIIFLIDDLNVMTRSCKLQYSNHYSDQELKMHTAPALLLQVQIRQSVIKNNVIKPFAWTNSICIFFINVKKNSIRANWL